jgi:hypothetical protein
MWKVYADRGFAIRTSFERVQIAFDCFQGEINGGVVDYIDFQRERTEVGNVFSHIVQKDLPYRDEREFRLLLWQIDPANKDAHTTANGIRVRVDLRKLIDKIYVSPLVKDIPSALYELVGTRSLDGSFESSVITHRTST